MNCEEFVLPPCELALPLVKEALRCLIHTVLFGRTIGGNVAVEPTTVRSKLIDIQYCKYNSLLEDESLEGKIREFAQKLESTSTQSLILVLAFYVPRHKSSKSLWDILSQPFDDKAVFERWKLQVNLPPKSYVGVASVADDEQRLIESATSQVRDRIFFIIRKLTDRMDQLPPPPPDQVPYHFEITFAGSQSVPGSPVPMAWSPKSIAQSIRSIPFIT